MLVQSNIQKLKSELVPGTVRANVPGTYSTVIYLFKDDSFDRIAYVVGTSMMWFSKNEIRMLLLIKVSAVINNCVICRDGKGEISPAEKFAFLVASSAPKRRATFFRKRRDLAFLHCLVFMYILAIYF